MHQIPTTLRRFRTFTLRSVIILISVFGVILGIWMNCLRTQQAIVREVEGLGGQVWNVDCGNDGKILAQYPSWLPSFAWPLVPRRLNYIYLTGETIHDEHLELILRLEPLEGLNISGSRISDRGLAKLRRCTNLRRLQLFDIPTITEAEIKSFQAALPDCEILR